MIPSQTEMDPSFSYINGAEPDADLMAEWAEHNAARVAGRHQDQPWFDRPVAVAPHEYEPVITQHLTGCPYCTDPDCGH